MKAQAALTDVIGNAQALDARVQAQQVSFLGIQAHAETEGAGCFRLHAFTAFGLWSARSLWPGGRGSRGRSPLPAVTGTARLRVYTLRMLALPDDVGRINSPEESKTHGAGKQTLRCRKASRVVEENPRCRTGKQQARPEKTKMHCRENAGASNGKAKKSKAEKRGMPFLPFCTFDPGVKFPLEPPS